MGATRSPRMPGQSGGPFNGRRPAQVAGQGMQGFLGSISSSRQIEDLDRFGSDSPGPFSPVTGRGGPVVGPQPARPQQPVMPQSTERFNGPMAFNQQQAPRSETLDRSFWGGNTMAIGTSSRDYQGLRGQLQNELMGRAGDITARLPNAPDQLGQAGQMNMQFGALPQLVRGDVRNVNGPQLGALQDFGRGDQIEAMQFQRNLLGNAPMVQGPGPIGRPDIGQANLNDAPQVSFQGFGGVDMVRDPRIAARGTNTQSVDQLGGQNSAFFQNMQQQLAPVFDQRRQLALAQAKEAAGNLTGSGYGHYLGQAVNRSLADEREALLGYASQGLQAELGRQSNQAGMANQRNLSQAQLQLQARQGNQDVMRQLSLRGGELGLQAGLANQDTARQYGLAGFQAEQDRLNRAAELGLQADTTSAELGLRAGLANQDVASRFGLSQFDADNQRQIEQGRLGLQAGMANQDARQAYDLQRQQLMNQRDLQGAQMGLDANLANQRMDSEFLNQMLQRGALQNNQDQLRLQQGTTNLENSRAYDLQRAQLGMDRYRTDADFNSANAQRIAGLMGQLGTAGVGQDEIVQRDGAMAALPAVGGLLGGMGGIGQQGGSGLFGGGGMDGVGRFGIAGDLAGRLGGLFGRGGIPGAQGAMDAVSQSVRAGGALGNIPGAAQAGGGSGFLGSLGSMAGSAALGAGIGYGGYKYAAPALGRAGDWLGNRVGVRGVGRAASEIGRGAAIGAGIGSVVPGIGTAIGGVVGGAIGSTAAVGRAAGRAGRWLRSRFSDERLKTDIRPLSGGLYEYRYVGSPAREVGFLAQELKQVAPKAVRKHKSGFLEVDYSKTTHILNALSRAERL